MVEVKVVINDAKTGKSYQKPFPQEPFLGLKLKDKLNGETLGLNGYELQVTGGSDDAGFPMRSDIQGTPRKMALLSSGVGVKKSVAGHKGIRIRKSVRGNTISSKTAQVNVKVVKYGLKSLEESLGVQPKAAE